MGFFYQWYQTGGQGKNIHLIICNTDEIEDAQEEKSLITEQMDNQVDAFIIQAAPGTDTAAMLSETSTQKPVILVSNNIQSQYSDLPFTGPDDYLMGYTLGEDLAARDPGDSEGKKVGIISGYKDTCYAGERTRGVLDALADTDYEIQFTINVTYETSITEMFIQQKPVDYLIVLETGILEEIAKILSDKQENGMKVYGIGSSIKCVYYLDEAVIDGLIVVDGYDMGYQSGLQISDMLNKRLHRIKNQATDYRLLHREDIFSEDTQKFLYTFY